MLNHRALMCSTILREVVDECEEGRRLEESVARVRRLWDVCTPKAQR